MVETKQDRLEVANDLITFISDRGRRFFYSKKYNRVAYFKLGSRGHIYFVDEYTGKEIYTHYSGFWRGFNHGGTMKRLVEALRDYIRKGTLLNPRIFGPWPDWYSQGDPWGYKEAMPEVKAEAIRLGIAEDDPEPDKEA